MRHQHGVGGNNTGLPKTCALSGAASRWDMWGVFRGATHPWHLNCSFCNLCGGKKQNSAASPTNGYKSPTAAVLVEQNKAWHSGYALTLWKSKLCLVLITCHCFQTNTLHVSSAPLLQMIFSSRKQWAVFHVNAGVQIKGTYMAMGECCKRCSRKSLNGLRSHRRALNFLEGNTVDSTGMSFSKPQIYIYIYRLL